MTRAERIEGALVGLLVGDALGVPYEFHPPEEIPPLEQLELEPPASFERAHEGTPVGTWSDDGAQALCLLASLLHCDKLDVDDLGKRFIDWYDSGYMAVNNRVFDVGITTSEAIRNLMQGVPALEAGIDRQNANGNGSLMRTLPLALWHKGTDEELITDAEKQSCVTHRHVRSQVCCALYCLWARNILNEKANPWETAVTSLTTAYQDDEKRTAELEFHIRPLEPYKIGGSGYVVDSLRSAQELAASESFELVAKRAITLGNDTDTTACVAGGIAGLMFGVDAIPKRWLAGLRGEDIYKPLVVALLERDLKTNN